MRRAMIAAAVVAAFWLTAAPAAHAQYFYGGGYGVAVPTVRSYTSTVGVPFGVRTYGVGFGSPYGGFAPGVVTYNSGYSGYVAPGTTFVTGGYSPWIAPGFNSYRYAPYAVPGVGIGRVGVPGVGVGRYGVGGFGMGRGVGFGRSFGGFR